MAYGIRSEDFVAACIYAAGCDVRTPVRGVVSRMCERGYESESGNQRRCFYGEDQYDINAAFMFLWIEERLIWQSDWQARLDELAETPLARWLGTILDYDHVYFNDEGTDWGAKNISPPSRRNVLMRSITTHMTCPEQTKRLLEANGWSPDTLHPDVLRNAWAPMYSA